MLLLFRRINWLIRRRIENPAGHVKLVQRCSTCWLSEPDMSLLQTPTPCFLPSCPPASPLLSLSLSSLFFKYTGNIYALLLIVLVQIVMLWHSVEECMSGILPLLLAESASATLLEQSTEPNLRYWCHLDLLEREWLKLVETDSRLLRTWLACWWSYSSIYNVLFMRAVSFTARERTRQQKKASFP